MIRRTTLLGCVLALALPIVGCDSDPDPVDGGGGTDAGPTDSGMMMMGDLPDPVGFGTARDALTAGDFSCRGTVTAPATDGADSTFTVVATDFFPPNLPVGGLSVDFFSDNTVVDTCAAPNCTNVTVDAAGTAMVTAPEGAWYAYRINAGEGTLDGSPEMYVDVVQRNEATPAAGGSEALNALRQSTVNTLTSVLLIQQQPGTTIVTGAASDCAGESIANARIRIFDSSGQVEFGRVSSGPKSFYFNGENFPNATETETNVDGLYGAGNIPVPADGMLRVELWGVTAADGDMEMLGCEMVNAVADGVAAINIGPTRSDGPSGCSGS